MNYEEVKELVITIFIWFYPFIFIFGIIGNVLAFLTFSRKKFAKMSFSIYFRFLAFTDSIALVAAINNFAKYRYDWAIADQSAFLCKTIHYMCDSIELSSAWLYVVISLDRLINIGYTNRFRFFNDKRFQIGIGFGIIIFNIVFDFVEVLFYWHFNPIAEIVSLVNSTNHTLLNQTVHTGGCIWVDPNNIFTWTYLVMEAILPFLLMFVFSALSIRIIFESRNRLKHKKKTTVSFVSTTSASASASSSTAANSTIKSKDTKFAVISIVLNVSFLLLNSPTNALYAFVYFFTFDFDFPYVITEMLYHLHFALIFYVNFWLNSIFKQECILMFRQLFLSFKR